jgi:hypothetical protein
VRQARLLLGLLALLTHSCIAPSVVAREDRALALSSADLEWSAASSADVPGTYVSVEISGAPAAVLRKLVYHFGVDGSYTGAALLDDLPPRFEVIGGHWRLQGADLHLDDSPPALLERAQDGSLRLSGAEGRVVLRREEDS